MKRLRFARDGYILMSAAFYAAAVLYMLLPEIPPKLLCITSGVFLLLYGVIKVVGFFAKDLYCLAFQYDLAEGVALMLLGAAVLAFGTRSVPYLTVGLGWLALLEGLLKVQMSRDAKGFGLETWKRILTAGLVTAVLSAALIFCAASHAPGQRLLAGLTMLSLGIMDQCVVHDTVKLKKQGAEA